MSNNNEQKLYRWVNVSERFPHKTGDYFLRHKYMNGTFHYWFSHINIQGIDKEFWLKLEYGWLEEIILPLSTETKQILPEDAIKFRDEEADKMIEKATISSSSVDKQRNINRRLGFNAGFDLCYKTFVQPLKDKENG